MEWTPSTTQSGIKTHSLGRGPDIVFSAGGPGFGSRVYRHFIESTADRFRWHLWDPKGTGDSQHPGPYSYQQDLKDLSEVVSHLKLQGTRYFLAGHSYGGLLTLGSCFSKDPHVLLKPAGLVLISTAANIGQPLAQLNNRKMEKLGAALAQDYLACIGEMLGGIATEKTYSKFIDIEIENQFNKPSQSLREKFTQHLDFSFQVFLTNIDWMGLNFEAELGKLEIPALIVQSVGDTIIPAEFSRSLSKIPKASVVEFTQSGHWSFIDESEKFFSSLEKFTSQAR